MSTINDALKQAARSAAGGQTPTPGGPAADLFPEALPREGVQSDPGAPEPVRPAPRLPRIPRWALAVGALALLALAYARLSPVPQARTAAAEPAIYRQKIVDERERLLAEEALLGSGPDEAAGQTAKGSGSGPRAREDQAKQPAAAGAEPSAVVRGAEAEGGDEEGDGDDEYDEDEEDDEDFAAEEATGAPANLRKAAVSRRPLPARRRRPAPAPQAPVPVNRTGPGFAGAGVPPYGPLPATRFAYAPPQPGPQPPVARPAVASSRRPQQALTAEIFRQAVAREREGKLDQARALYALVLDKEPGRQSASLRLGNLLYRQQRYNEASEVFRKAIGNRDSAVLHNNLGTVYLAQGKMNLAREEFTTAANSDAAYVDPRYNLACYYSLTGQPQQGLAELEKAKAIDPQVMEWAAKDGDLAGLRAMPGYKRLTK